MKVQHIRSDAGKAVVRRKFMTLTANIRKEEMFQLLNSLFKKLD